MPTSNRAIHFTFLVMYLAPLPATGVPFDPNATAFVILVAPLGFLGSTLMPQGGEADLDATAAINLLENLPFRRPHDSNPICLALLEASEKFGSPVGKGRLHPTVVRNLIEIELGPCLVRLGKSPQGIQLHRIVQDFFERPLVIEQGPLGSPGSGSIRVAHLGSDPHRLTRNIKQGGWFAPNQEKHP